MLDRNNRFRFWCRLEKQQQIGYDFCFELIKISKLVTISVSNCQRPEYWLRFWFWMSQYMHIGFDFAVRKLHEGAYWLRFRVIKVGFARPWWIWYDEFGKFWIYIQILYPFWQKDIYPDHISSNWIYILDIISLDIYPTQCWSILRPTL